MERITVPELHCPFPPAISDFAAIVQHDTFVWAQRCGLIADGRMTQRVQAANFGELAARIHPTAARDALRLVSDWYACMFFMDDQCDETELGRRPEQLAILHLRYMEILRGSDSPTRNGPLMFALSDLRKRFEALAHGTWMHRFLHSVRRYFHATLWEATNRKLNRTPELTAYGKMRPVTAGLEIDNTFIRIAERTYVPPEIFRHDGVRALTAAANNAVCWANDIMSLEKELKRHDVHNLVLVLQKAHGTSIQAAVDQAAGMYHAEIGAFVAMEPRLPSFGPVADAGLQRYLAVLRTRIRGNLDWARASGRYQLQEDSDD